jgi:hypothetical protein
MALDHRLLGARFHNGHHDMRSTRATAAIARLNARCAGHHYTMALTGNGLLILRERVDVQLVDSLGPKKEVRISKSEADFMKQLVRKDGAT